MASVFDVAKYILERTGPITAMKLQKLCYYAQAWSLVWDETPLFDERIEAWVNGPVVPPLYQWHKGSYMIESVPEGNADNIAQPQKESIDVVVSYYGSFNSQQLSDLTHMEDPWRLARKGLPETVRGTSVISQASMAEYYSSL